MPMSMPAGNLACMLLPEARIDEKTIFDGTSADQKMVVQVIEDVVPKQWVPPFEGKGRSGSASAASKPPVKGKAKEGSSSGSLQGLEAVLGTGREDRWAPKTSPQVLWMAA